MPIQETASAAAALHNYPRRDCTLDYSQAKWVAAGMTSHFRCDSVDIAPVSGNIIEVIDRISGSTKRLGQASAGYSPITWEKDDCHVGGRQTLGLVSQSGSGTDRQFLTPNVTGLISATGPSEVMFSGFLYSPVDDIFGAPNNTTNLAATIVNGQARLTWGGVAVAIDTGLGSALTLCDFLFGARRTSDGHIEIAFMREGDGDFTIATSATTTSSGIGSSIVAGRIVNGVNSGSNNLYGRMAEMITFNTDPGATVRSEVRAYQKNYFGF